MPKTSSRFPQLPKWAFPWGLIALFILFVAGWFRFWELGSNPVGLSWDEAFLGYVGKMVITTGRDDYGRFLPVVFESFGDFKAPLAVYLTGMSTTIFGLSVWAVRLPFALAGLAAVGLAGAVVGTRTKSWGWGLLAAWILATLPWHIHFSRIGFESGMALTSFAFFLFGWQLIRGEEQLSLARRSLGWLSILGGLWSGLYVYHSAKIVFPLAVLVIGGWELIFFWSVWKKRWPEILGGLILGSVGLLPFLQGLLRGGLQRANQTVFWNHLFTGESFWQRLAENISAHLSPSFWLLGATDTLRHGNGMGGVVTFSIVITLIAGTFWLLWTQQSRDTTQSRSRLNLRQPTDLWLWGALTFIALVPAIIGAEVPHPNRALLAAFPLVILVTLLLRLIWQHTQGNTRQLILASFLVLSALETGNYWRDLSLLYPERSAVAWLDGNVTASRWTAAQAAAGNTVAVSNAYGEPHVFFAFTTNWSYERYRKGDFGRIQFMDQDELLESNMRHLVSTEPLEDENYSLETTINRKDGQPAYWLYARIVR